MLTCKCDRDVIAGQIEDMLAVRPGMVDANRQARLAEIDAEILNAEMSEESAIRRLERQGVSIARRDIPEPANLSAADRAFINRYRAEKGIK